VLGSLFESVNGDLARDVSASTPRRERRLKSCRSNGDDDAFGRRAHRANESEAGLILLKEGEDHRSIAVRAKRAPASGFAMEKRGNGTIEHNASLVGRERNALSHR
jgi:hypothetical protein